MANAVRMEVSGFKQLGERLKLLSAEVSTKAARAATAKAANVVKKAAKAKVPKDTGALSEGIITKRIPPSETNLTSEHIVTISTRRMAKYVKKSRAAIVELEGPSKPVMVKGRLVIPKRLARKEEYVTFGDLFYGPFIEFGTVKMAPRPFLRPALDENVGKALEAMRASLEASIKKAT